MIYKCTRALMQPLKCVFLRMKLHKRASVLPNRSKPGIFLLFCPSPTAPVAVKLFWSQWIHDLIANLTLKPLSFLC